MNDITYVERTNSASGQIMPAAERYDHVWLITELQSGIEQAEQGETIVANKAFFDDLQKRLFSSLQEDVIQA